eukprot:9767880-Karenia_brevis.AAC.1
MCIRDSPSGSLKFPWGRLSHGVAKSPWITRQADRSGQGAIYYLWQCGTGSLGQPKGASEAAF